MPGLQQPHQHKDRKNVMMMVVCPVLMTTVLAPIDGNTIGDRGLMFGMRPLSGHTGRVWRALINNVTDGSGNQ